MSFLNNPKINRGKPFDGSSILDIHTNLDSIPLYYAIQFYYEVYKKMVKMLEVAFSGYLIREYTYVPVDDYLNDMYDQFGHLLKFLALKPEIDEIPVITLYGIRLNGNFVEEIELWNKFKDEIPEDVKYLSKLVTNPHPIPPDLQLAFDRVDIRLLEHLKKKEEVLNKERGNILFSQDLQLNISKATLRYKKNKPFPISFNQAIRLLEYLLINKGEIKEYIDIARYLNLNSLTPDSENIDVARNIQFIKKQLVEILRDTGMGNNDIKKMINSITNKGYKIN